MRDAPVSPLYVSSKNAEHASGQSWRWIRDFANAHGIEILRVGAKSFIRAAELADALEREAARSREQVPADSRVELARRLGAA